ncbi:MAG: phage holin family protein [Rhodocyclaceae bacterium]|nr:phage holin family protein [Rhodocyclaceae bacterium]
MISPLIRLVLRDPGLLAEHVGSYSALARHELRDYRRHLFRRLGWLLLLFGSLLAGVVLSGVSVLLWALGQTFHPAMVAVPAVPLAAALIAGVALIRHDGRVEPMARTWDQFDADLRLLEERP